MPSAVILPRATPETRGIHSSAILAFVDAADREIHDLHSLILLRHGAIVAEGYWEPYGPTYPHMLFSLSKSFTSTAIGLLVAERRLSVDDFVLDHFRDEAPAQPSDHLRAMRVRHLLTMTTGHVTEPLFGNRQATAEWTNAFLTHPVEQAPGTHFLYNSLATYMLSAIAQRLTGERIVRYLEPRLFTPLGIEGPTWEMSPEGIDVGGWGLSVTTCDIARFGQLYLQRGVWQGKELLPAAWVDEATARQVPNGPSPNVDWVQGYGYQFWRCRHGAYRGDGAHGQFCVVMPGQDAVLALTAGVGNMQSVLDLVWTQLLPAMNGSPLSGDSGAERALSDRLAGLRLAPKSGQRVSSRANKWSGREFQISENPTNVKSIRFDFTADSDILTIRDGRNEQELPCGHGRWLRSEGAVLAGRGTWSSDNSPSKVAASGAWVGDDTYVADLCWYETPFRRTMTFKFDGDELSVDQRLNVSFGPTELPGLAGRAVG